MALLFQLERSQWAAPADIEAMQMRQLEALLAHAAKTVPFYRDRLRPLAKLGTARLTPEHLRRLPVLRRGEILDSGPAIISRALPKGHGPTADFPTSGSTGRPVVVKHTGVTQLFYSAFNMRMHLWHGRDFGGIVAALQLLAVHAETRSGDQPKTWASTFGPSPMVKRDIRTPVEEQVRWLLEIDPHYILTYPSNVMAVAEAVGRSGARLGRLRHVATLGETLRSDQRDACREHLGVDVFDTYSSFEAGVLAIQCPGHSHYLVQSEGVYFEVVDERGEPCRPGEIGRVLVTVLHNFAMPLIRYEIGDYAEVGGPCPTGRGLPTLNRILGRARNMLVLASGDRIWPPFRLAYLNRRVPFKQARLVQRSVGEVVVLVVRDEPFTPAESADVVDELTRQVGHPIRFSIEYVDDIPRSPGGKYEDFLCEI